MINRKVLVLFALASMEAFAQSYSYYYTMRAGRFAGADWELGAGANSSASNSTQQFNHNERPGNNHWGSALTEHAFQIGWSALTNTAYVTVWNDAGNPVTANFAPSGPTPAPTAIWTIPASSLFVSAAGQPSGTATSVTLSGLSLSTGVNILSGSLPTSLSASQSANVSGSASISAPLVIDPASAGGSWYLAGTIRFTGLQSQGGVATGSQLQFLMNAVASDVPEAGTLSMIGVGLVAFAEIRRRQRRLHANGSDTRA